MFNLIDNALGFHHLRMMRMFHQGDDVIVYLTEGEHIVNSIGQTNVRTSEKRMRRDDAGFRREHQTPTQLHS